MFAYLGIEHVAGSKLYFIHFYSVCPTIALASSPRSEGLRVFQGPRVLDTATEFCPCSNINDGKLFQLSIGRMRHGIARDVPKIMVRGSKEEWSKV